MFAPSSKNHQHTGEMAQVDCAILESDGKDAHPKGTVLGKDDGDGGPPSKKLKQARLPFKPLEQKPQIVSPQGPKKRKLSDGESPSAKLHKNHKQERQPSGDNKSSSQCIVDHDPEVSSSSEAENMPVGFQNRIRNTLERFVKKGIQFQEEITSTNDCIDLVEKEETQESDEKGENTDKCPKVDLTEESSLTASNELEKICTSEETVDKTNVDKENVPVAITSAGITGPQEEHSEQEDEEPETENLEVIDVSMKDVSADEKEAVSVDDSKKDDLSVSSSQGDPESPPVEANKPEPKTPKSADTSDCPKTPVSQSPGENCSEGTPKSGKKKARSKFTTPKTKDKDGLRQKIKEQKDKEFEERKLKKEEERLEKERIKEEKKKEKEEAKVLKEKQKEEDKEKKEKDRQEKLQLKEGEKKKKQEHYEAKMEEKKKKEEEVKQKKEEKMREEEVKEKKASKTKQAFQSFFINKQRTSPGSKVKEEKSLFMPFEVKKDMKLAPSCRRQQLDDEATATLDDQLSSNQGTDRDLYLEELKDGKTLPWKYIKSENRRILDDDVLLVHDSEVVKKVTYHCKLLQFHKNYRPPYYGTWRKQSKIISPKNPFKQDKDLFDYEVDSDDEWEEEEPGESLSASEGEEEEEGEGEEMDDWMVPHGYLSEDEGCQDDDEQVTPEMLKAIQKAKLESWESELKRTTKAALPVIIGCMWEQAVHSLQKQLEETLNSYQAVCLGSDPIPTSHSGIGTSKLDCSPSEKNMTTPKNGMRKPVPEEAMPDLIRLVHGNLAGIKKLIKEFRTFWKQKVSGETNPPEPSETKMEVDTTEVKDGETPIDKPVAMDTSEVSEDADHHCISKRQMELKISAIAVREKRPTYKKVCWYVHDKVLEQFGFTDLPIPSTWEFVSQPSKPKSDEPTTPTPSAKTPKVSITQFARPMSPSEIAAQHAAVAAKQAAEASARLAALKAASEQAEQEAAARQLALQAALQQAALVNAIQQGKMQVIQNPSFTLPKHKSLTNITTTSSALHVTPKGVLPLPVPPGGSPQLTQGSPDNVKKRIIPTMLSPLAQKLASSPKSGKSVPPNRIIPIMFSPNNAFKMGGAVVSPNNPLKRACPTTMSPSNPLKMMSPTNKPQKRLVPTMVSPLFPKTKVEPSPDIVAKSTANNIASPLGPSGSLNNVGASPNGPGRSLNVASSPQGPTRPMNVAASPQGPARPKQVDASSQGLARPKHIAAQGSAKPENQVTSSATSGSNSDDAIVID